MSLNKVNRVYNKAKLGQLGHQSQAMDSNPTTTGSRNTEQRGDGRPQPLKMPTWVMPRLCLLVFFLLGQKPILGYIPLGAEASPAARRIWWLERREGSWSSCWDGEVPCRPTHTELYSLPVALGTARKLCPPSPPTLSLHLKETKWDEISAASSPFKDRASDYKESNSWPPAHCLPLASCLHSSAHLPWEEADGLQSPPGNYSCRRDKTPGSR